MRENETLRSVKAEINARRLRGGAPDVPSWLWEQPEVGAALRAAVEQAQRDAFDGDWQEASLPLEDLLDALAAALREASQRMPVVSSYTRPIVRNQVAESDRGRRGGEASLPDIVRHDVGGVALADYLSWRLRSDGFADWCRRTICGGEYVTREEAWEFLTAPLPKVLSTDDYERLGLCPVRTQGRLLSKYLQRTANAPFFYTNMLMIDPTTGRPTATTDTLYGGTESYCAEVYLPAVGDVRKRRKRLVLHLSHDGYSYVAGDDLVPKPYQVPGVHEGTHVAPLAAPFFPEGGRFVEGYAASVMGELIGTAHMLCECYPVSIWDMLEALLTGTLPPQPAIEMYCLDTRIEKLEAPDELPSADHDPDPLEALGPVTLTVQPWVTPEVLADAWRECRKRNKCYSPSAMQADTMGFVLSHTPPGQEFQWERLARQWQEERGEGMTRGTLHKQFMRAKAAILPPCAEEA